MTQDTTQTTGHTMLRSLIFMPLLNFEERPESMKADFYAYNLLNEQKGNVRLLSPSPAQKKNPHPA